MHIAYLSMCTEKELDAIISTFLININIVYFCALMETHLNENKPLEENTHKDKKMYSMLLFKMNI